MYYTVSLGSMSCTISLFFMLITWAAIYDMHSTFARHTGITADQWHTFAGENRKKCHNHQTSSIYAYASAFPCAESIAPGCRSRSGKLGRHLLLRSGACAETVLGTARHCLQVAHATGTGGLPANRLLAPLVVASLGGRIATRRAS